MSGPSTDFTGKDAVPVAATYDAKNVAGKSVIVTGGASGIGEAAVRAFAKAGAFVTFSDLTEDRAKTLVAELGKDKVAFVQGNVTVWADQVKLFKTALAQSSSKSVDVVFANAGIGRLQDPVVHEQLGADGEPTEPDLTVLNTNLIGVTYTVSLALQYFAKNPEGQDRDRCLVMTASIAGYFDMPGAYQYNVSKFGVRGIMRCLRGALPPHGARVNLIAPWWVRTNIINDAVKARIDAQGTEWADVDDAASAVLHIASDKSINGRSLFIVPRTSDSRGYMDTKEDDQFPATGRSELEVLIAKLSKRDNITPHKS